MARRQAQEPDRYQARFTGRFEVEPDDADLMELDADLMVVVLVRVDGDAEKFEKNGDKVWTGVLGVRDAGVIRDPQLMSRIHEELRLEPPDPQLPFYELQNPGSVENQQVVDPADVHEVEVPPISVDVETGEVFRPDAGRLPVAVGGSKDPALKSFLES